MIKNNFRGNLCAGLVILAASCQVFAQENVAPNLGFEMTGYLDFYYQSSPQGHVVTPATTGGPYVVEGRYFDRHVNQMTLNMAEISLKKKSGKVTFKADVAVGEMVDQLSGGSSQSVTATNAVNPAANEPTRNLTQATVSYAVNDRLSFTAGKFYSHMGLEVTKAKDNWQYSRSYTYNYGIPFWHEGVSGTVGIIPEKLTTTIYLLNAWDGRNSAEQNQATTVGANLNFTGLENFVMNYNYIGGAETTDKSRREVHELNVTYNLNPTFSFAADYVMGTQKNIPAMNDMKWNGLTLYMKAAVTSFYTISPRYEMFDDSDNGYAISGGFASAGVKQKITSFTLSNNFNLGDGLEARVEARLDKSDSKLYFKDKDGSETDRQDSYAVAVLYAF